MTPQLLARSSDRDDRPGRARPVEAPADPAERAGQPLRCAACAREIADRDAAIAVQGAHEHHFVNPHGHDFHVGVFREAPGCALVGPPEAFFSWFPGLPWRIAVCSGCHIHLGWAYGVGVEFFALILPRLRDD